MWEKLKAFRGWIIGVAATIAAISIIVGTVGLTLPKPAWSHQLLALKEDVYIDRYERVKKDLRQIKLEEYRHQQIEETPPPEFLIEEKLELEDEVRDLEKKLESISIEKKK